MRTKKQAKQTIANNVNKILALNYHSYLYNKIDGKFESWLPFWEKFTSEIESTKIPTLTKFAYLLKELLDESVRCDIDEVGYSKAKDILETECGQSAEVANAYTV